jgi:hypothetical protein
MSRITAKAFAAKHSRKPAKSEHCLQRSVVKWCNGLGKNLVQGRFFAVPNGGARDIITASKLKAEGVRPGIPDLVFYGPDKSILWLELKNGTAGKLSASQVEVHRDLYHAGHTVIVGRTFAECVTEITNFYQS